MVLLLSHHRSLRRRWRLGWSWISKYYKGALLSEFWRWTEVGSLSIILSALCVKLASASLFFSWMVTLAHTIYYSQPHLISGSLQSQLGLLSWDISHGLCLGWSDFSLGCLLFLCCWQLWVLFDGFTNGPFLSWTLICFSKSSTFLLWLC